MIHLLRFASPDWDSQFLLPEPVGRFSELAEGRVLHCATGRQAIFALVAHLALKPSACCLLPAYVAEGVISPIEAAGLKLSFYKLTPSLMIDLEELERIVTREPQLRLIVIIHPFGVRQPVAEIRRILASSREQVVILEDDAQALFSGMDAIDPAERGDFSLFSFNKFLPVTDGATLLSHHDRFQLRPFSGVSPALLESARVHLDWNRKLFEEQDPVEARVILREVGASYEAYYRHVHGHFEPRSISPDSWTILQRANFELMKARRVANAEYLARHLDPARYQPVVSPSDCRAGLFAYPVRALRRPRNEVIELSLNHNILLSTLVEKWDFRPAGDDRFPCESEFLEQHLLIPVSEMIVESQLERLVGFLNQL